MRRQVQPTYSGPSADKDIALLFKPLTLGQAKLRNRIVYAPLTRCRAKGNIPQDNAIEYYTQRARGCEGGLIINEGTAVSESGRGWAFSYVGQLNLLLHCNSCCHPIVRASSNTQLGYGVPQSKDHKPCSTLSVVCCSYIDVPGIYNQAQMQQWKKITGAVKAHGATFYCQLWHTGRVSHASQYQPQVPCCVPSI